jgi:tetratricopeptide (TPR) repeat protein
LQLGHLDDAKTSIETALAQQPRSGTAHFAAANIYARLGAAAQADEHRRLVEKLKAGQPGQRRTFEEDYESALREVVSPLYTAIALVYDTQGQAKDAEHWCRRAIALVPSAPDPHRLLVNIYRSGGRIGNAHLVQRRLAELEPANVANHINLANLALALGRLDDAERALLDAARIAPQNALVRRMLAAVLVERGDLTQAREAAQQAVQLEPSADGYELLAAICRQQGDVDAGAIADRAAMDLKSAPSP